MKHHIFIISHGVTLVMISPINSCENLHAMNIHNSKIKTMVLKKTFGNLATKAVGGIDLGLSLCVSSLFCGVSHRTVSGKHGTG